MERHYNSGEHRTMSYIRYYYIYGTATLNVYDQATHISVWDKAIINIHKDCTVFIDLEDEEDSPIVNLYCGYKCNLEDSYGILVYSMRA